MGYTGGVLGAGRSRGAKNAEDATAFGARDLRGRKAPRMGDDQGQNHLPRPRSMQKVSRNSLYAAHCRVPLVRDGARADSVVRHSAESSEGGGGGRKRRGCYVENYTALEEYLSCTRDTSKWEV